MREVAELFTASWSVPAFVVLGAIIGALNLHVANEDQGSLLLAVIATCLTLAYPLLGIALLFASAVD